MEGVADATRGGGEYEGRNVRPAEGQEFKQLKVRISKDDIRSPRKSMDASIHSLLGGHGGPAGWLWRNSVSGAPPHAHTESSLYNTFSGADSSRCPSSPVHVPVTMAYTPAPGYVMFPVMISGAPDSPRGGLTPLMGSPVSTPTAMMFPQTPFAQHPSAGPFAPPQGPGGPVMRPTSISGAPTVSGGPTGHEATASAYFHPLFNGFNAFGAPPGISIAPHGAYNGPAGPVMQMPQPQPQCPKQSRNSTAGEKVRPYQPSPLKPGPRKSSSNGGPPATAVGSLPLVPLMGGSGGGGRTVSGVSGVASAAGGSCSSNSASSPAQTSSTGSSGATGTHRTGCRPLHAHCPQQPQSSHQVERSFHTPASGGVGSGVGATGAYHQQSGVSAANAHGSGPDGGSGTCGVDGGDDANEVSSNDPSSASPAQPAAVTSPEPAMPASYGNAAASVRNGTAPAGASATTTRDVLKQTTAAAAAAVVAAAAAAFSNMSTGPTPRTSYTGPSATPPPPRNSVSGGGAIGTATASGRTSSSGITLPSGAAAAAAATALGAPRVSLSDESASGSAANLGTDVGLSNGDMDIPSYGSYLANGMAAAHHMGGHAAAAAAAWGFYDASSAAAATAAGLGAQQMWPTGVPRLYGAPHHVMASGMSHLAHHPHTHHHHQQQVAAMAAAAAAQHSTPQQSAAAAAAMQQPTLLQAAMLQQLAAAANVQGSVTAAMPCYAMPTSPAMDNDYMAAAEQLAQLQALQVAQQNLRAAAAAAAVADIHHPVMAAAASAAGLAPGGMLVNPALLSGALGGHSVHSVHQHPHHLGGGMAMHSLGMGGLAPRPRRNHGNNMGAGSSGGASGGGGAGPDGQVRLNARQRRTLRRAKERAIRGLLEAGKLLVTRRMCEGGGEGDDGAASGCELPSGGYDDTDDGDQSDDGESPARPACVSARSVSGGSAVGAPSPDLSASSAASAAAPNGASSVGIKYGSGGSSGGAVACSNGQATTPDHQIATGATGQQLLSSQLGLTGGSHSPSSSNASSVCEAGSSAVGPAISNTSSVAGPEASSSALGAAGTNGTPCSGKISQLSAEGSNETSPALPAVAQPPPPPRAGGAVANGGGGSSGGARVSPAPSGRSTSAGSGISAAAGPVVSAAAALASGGATDVDITALIQQLNLKREEGLVDEKLLRDLEIINNLIGALKSNVPSAAPSYNAQGRKPSGGHAHSGHVHSHHTHHHVQHNMVNTAHAVQYLSTGFPKLAKGFTVGY